MDNSSVTSVTRKANKKKRDDDKIGDDNKRHRPNKKVLQRRAMRPTLSTLEDLHEDTSMGVDEIKFSESLKFYSMLFA